MHSLTNLDGMNSDPQLMSSQLNNEGNSFAGFGDERQDDMESNMAGIASMENPGLTEQMGDGQATMEGQQEGMVNCYFFKRSVNESQNNSSVRCDKLLLHRYTVFPSFRQSSDD